MGSVTLILTYQGIGIDRFQLTRSVGSVTTSISEYKTTCKISTHTLRGERDGEHKNNIIEAAFQLTRSVGSVTNKLDVYD